VQSLSGISSSLAHRSRLRSDVHRAHPTVVGTGKSEIAKIYYYGFRFATFSGADSCCLIIVAVLVRGRRPKRVVVVVVIVLSAAIPIGTEIFGRNAGMGIQRNRRPDESASGIRFYRGRGRKRRIGSGQQTVRSECCLYGDNIPIT